MGIKMGELIWKDEYCIGHFKTDYEHKELVSLANRVIKFSNDGEDITKIQSALKTLNDYCKIHFRNEEMYMASIGYPDLDHHKQCHKELIERMNAAVTGTDDLNILVHQLKRLMVVWVIEHIINEDKKIAPA
jgi:hemerythrin